MVAEILNDVLKYKIIAIIRGIPSPVIVSTVEAILKGGIRCIEIPFSHSSLKEYLDTLHSLSLVREKFEEKIFLGAGSVLTSRDVRNAADAGARYIISPNCDRKVIEQTKSLHLMSMPGAFTPTEIVSAHNWGADLVKVFPAYQLGPDYFKSVSVPLAHIPLAAVGGITPDNVYEYLNNGACCVGIGANLANPQLIAKKNFKLIENIAKEYFDNVHCSIGSEL